jgi:hypothetical protein
MRLPGYEAFIGDRRVAYRVLVGRTEGRRTLGRPRHRWEDNNEMDFKVLGWGGTNWVYLV